MILHSMWVMKLFVCKRSTTFYSRVEGLLELQNILKIDIVKNKEYYPLNIKKLLE